MERRQTGESGQAAGGSVPILGARHEHKWRLADAGLKSFLLNRRFSENHLFIRKLFRTRAIVSVRPREERQRRGFYAWPAPESSANLNG